MTKRKYAHGNALVLEALGNDGSMYRGRFIIHRGQLTCEHFGASCQYGVTVLSDTDSFEFTEEQMDALKRHVLKHAPEGPRLDERKWTRPVDQYVDASIAQMLRNMALSNAMFADVPRDPPVKVPVQYVLEELAPPPAVEAFQQLTARTPATTTHDAIYRARELHWKGRPR